MSASIYKSLRLPKSTQVLTLQPAASGSDLPLVGSLCEVDLSKPSHYEAVSYTWGSAEAQQIIVIDGTPVKVRRYLDSFLRRLRLPRAPRRLWVDALCINQNDLEERSSQVAMMKDIYARAAEVVIWLGKERCDTFLAFRMLHGLADLWDMTLDGAKDLLSHLVRNEDSRKCWLALGQFLGRPWWNRIWVVQEIVMARKAFVLCGRWAAEWAQVDRATATFKYCFDYIDEIQEANIYQQSKELNCFSDNESNFQLT